MKSDTCKSSTGIPRIAFYAGSFNPFTPGHADIVARGLMLFDRITIGIGINIDKPEAEATATQRAEKIRKLYAGDPRINVITYRTLTTEAAVAAGACCLLRGARNATDFEYERNIADANRLLAPELETVILPSRPELACISSSLMRELARYGRQLPEI